MFLAILLNTIFEQYVSVLKYLDETAIILSLGYIFIYLAGVKRFQSVKYILMYLLVTIITGVAGNII